MTSIILFLASMGDLTHLIILYLYYEKQNIDCSQSGGYITNIRYKIGDIDE